MASSEILDKIIESKKKELEELKNNFPIEKLQKNLVKSDRDFFKALKGKNNIIAELKFKGPITGSTGNRTVEDIPEIIEAYDCYASAISVLTDKPFFGGDLSLIKKVKEHTKLPVLRKDFIIDGLQIYESRYYGADAVLLMANILNTDQINEMINIAESLGMHCLVEVGSEEELRKVLTTTARIIGINNRDFSSEDLSVDLGRTKRMKGLIPTDKIIVSESGIKTKEQIIMLDTNAVLMGTTLMGSPDIKAKISSLFRTKVKICGITNQEDADYAVSVGADFLGFNFYSKSPRYISFENAKKIIDTLPNTVQTVGVFVNSDEKEIKKIIEESGIDIVQLHGDEDAEFCNRVSSSNAFVIKAFRVKEGEKVDTSKFKVYTKMFDAFSADAYGGTGKKINLSRIYDQKGKLFIAGGLSPDNILNIKKEFEELGLHPFAVDVCSGVEEYPGKKNDSKVKKLIVFVRS